MGFLGSKAAIDAAVKKNVITEEEKQLIEDKFDSSLICSSNGTYCLKGCKFKEGSDCQRLINKKADSKV